MRNTLITCVFSQIIHMAAAVSCMVLLVPSSFQSGLLQGGFYEDFVLMKNLLVAKCLIDKD